MNPLTTLHHRIQTNLRQRKAGKAAIRAESSRPLFFSDSALSYLDIPSYQRMRVKQPDLPKPEPIEAAPSVKPLWCPELAANDTPSNPERLLAYYKKLNAWERAA